MRALVTGGSGFIGSHLVDRLRARGVTARIYDMVFPTWRQDIEFYHGSLLDSEALRMALNGVDVVYHLAAVADVKDVFEHPHESEAINVRGTINVLEAMRRTGVKRIIYGSTTWVYSDTPGDNLDEDATLVPPSHLYSVTKLVSEHYCRSYQKLYSLEPTILRYGIPYGPRARAGAVVPIFVGRALQGQTLSIAGDGLQFRQFVYVEDLAEGNVLALKPVAKGKTYNLDGTERVSIRQIAETVQKTVGKVAIEYGPARPGDFSGRTISSRRALEELGWKPQVSFEEGVRRYVEWFKATQLAKERQREQVDPELLRA